MGPQDYRPAPSVLERLKEVDFVAVVGPTAVGKTTLIHAAAASSRKVHMMVAGVSRAPRPGEKDGVDFHFDSKRSMQARARRGEYVTVVIGATGDLYTTAPEDYPTDKIVILAVLAEAIPLFRSLPYKSFRTIFVLPASWQQWQERLQSRGFSPEQLAPRMTEAKKSLQFALGDADTQFVINDDLDAAVKDFEVLALGAPLNDRLHSDRSRAKLLAKALLSKW